MWTIEDTVQNITNKVVIPEDGTITISKPDTARVNAYVNDAVDATQQVDVKAGDTVYFKLTNYKKSQTPIGFEYMGKTTMVMLPGKEMPVLNKLVALDGEPLAIISETADSGETTEEDIMITPQETINLFANPNQGTGTGGAMGAGLGAGLLGGVLGGALLGGNNGGLFGNRNGDGGAAASTLVLENAIAATERLTNARFDAQAQAAIEASIERTNAANLLAIATGNSTLGVLVAKGQGETNTQNALNAAALGVQIEKTAAATALATALGQRDVLEAQNAATALLAAQLAQTQYNLANAIKADGDQTRGILITQNDTNLNRMLVNAQNEIIELRGDSRLNERTRGIEITTTNNINQMQQQQQQQVQFDRLTGYIASLAQNIQSTNQAINVGSGTQTANPLNTNTQIR